MSLAEQMLDTMSASDSSAPRLGNEGRIVIDASRRVIIPPKLKTIAVTNDSNIETVTFECIRYWDGHDLSTFSIYLNYVLPDMTTGTYVVKQLEIFPDNFLFDWTITRNITKKSGTLTFGITAVKQKVGDDGSFVVDKRWSSLPNTDFQIASGLDISNIPDDEENADILAQMSAILQQMQQDVTTWIKPAVVQTTGTSTAQVMSQYAVTTALDNNKKDYTSKISRNSKRLTNIEKGYSDELFVTGNMGSVYERTVPYNALPYAEVKKIYGGAKKAADGVTILPKKALRVESCKSAEKEILDATLDLSEMRETMTVEKLADGSFKFNGYTSSYGNGGRCKFATVNLPKGSYGINYKVISGEVEHVVIKANDTTIVDVANEYYGKIHATEDMTLNLYVDFDRGHYAGTGLDDLVLSFEIQKGTWDTGGFVPEIETIATLEIPEAVRNLDFYGYSSNHIDLERRVFVREKILVDNTPTTLAKPEEIDISPYIGDDNFIEVAPNGYIKVIEDTGEAMACKCEVEFMLKGV